MGSIGIAMVGEMLRPYQKAWLKDTSRFRSYLKSRRIGVSTGCIALESVLISSGLYEEFSAPANSNCVSKVEDDAKDLVRHARKWIDMLSKDPQLRPHLELENDSATELRFKRTGYHIRSYTQSPKAARGGNGNFYGDEMAFWPHANDIWDGGVQAVFGNPDWRASFVSTPNGTSGQGELFYRIMRDPQFAHISRHETNLLEAIEQGFPADADEIRRGSRSEEAFLQEYMCQFIGAAGEYFPRDFLDALMTERPMVEGSCWLGIDVASLIDLTAVHVIRLIGGVLWLCETYLISRLPYQSDDRSAGQDALVAALIRKYRPEGAMMDVTGDGSKLFVAVSQMLGPIAGRCLIPHTMSQEWKVDIVPDLKGSMERGRVRIDQALPTYALDHAALERLGLTRGNAATSSAEDIARGAFARRDWGAQLRSDFQKVHKRLTPSGQTTYDTHRDSSGHGDSFWAAAMAYALCRHLIGDTLAPQMDSFWGDAGGGVVAPEFVDYL